MKKDGLSNMKFAAQMMHKKFSEKLTKEGFEELIGESLEDMGLDDAWEEQE